MRLLIKIIPIVLAFPAMGKTEKYALLVGVGKYQSVRPQLAGPAPDVVAVGTELQDKWGFSTDNIQELVDSAATKVAILAALDLLVNKLKAGDVGFFYFSGHGTSFFDTTLRDKAAVFDPNSGALVPYDARIGTLTDAARSLIIGSKDLRPRLLKVVRGATVLVVFDSCYSGGSARSLLEMPTRGIPAGQLVTKQAFSDEEAEAFGVPGAASNQAEPVARVEAWPYSNVLYISAASKMEKAIDIDWRIMREHPTVDQQPHGALTNSLLKGLKGQADSNHDGTINYEELYQFVSQRVENEFNHRPQFESPSPAYARGALFGQKSAPVAAEDRPREGVTRVRIENLPSSFSKKVRDLKDVQVTENSFDLLVRPGRDGGYDLFHSSYDRIRYFAVGEEQELLSRIAYHGNARRLVNLSFSQQSFNISLGLARVDGTAGEAEFYLEDKVRVSVSAEKACFGLLLNIDTAGDVTILAAAHIVAGKAAPFGQPLRVSMPVGLEYLKLVAFPQKPEGFDDWAKRFGDTLSPASDDFAKLMTFLQGSGATAAQFVTKFFTAKKI